ncbi:hypothetical protein RM553_06235 [Zunongwangia sp. F363]|uniref:Peptidase E n=1 Tax=Autumnicola tepida TaxID=3075595 RepID=A0ABU3C7W5_9FLAO|nr:DUF6702 family protein [Zunongwangia sp. F363]MDT0642427.1 hypothetical protein [Zunongwangia sp. F363]
MKKFAVLLTCFLAFSSFSAEKHKFYVSVTEIAYKEDPGTFQIISRVFIDDIQKVLNKRYGTHLSLSHEKEEGNVKETIAKYLAQKLQISVDGKELELHYLGKEYEEDQLVLYIEVEGVPPFHQVTVTNAILTDLYSEQKNVVHVEVGDEIKSLLLELDREMGTINFQD